MTGSTTFNAADGDGYERVMGRWSRRLAGPFLDFVGGGDVASVLDVGCGTGALLAALAARGTPRRIVGVDFSPVYVGHAKRALRDARVELQVGDACALPFADGSFDCVLSLLLLHFVPSAQLAIAQMKRVARPGAVVAAAVWDVRGGFVANRIFFDTAAALDANANERRATNYTRPMTRPGELERAWRYAGFENVTETTLTIRMDFLSFADYWEPYEGRDGPAAQYVGSLDAAARSRLKDAVRAAYVDGEADGPRSYAAMAFAVKGSAPA